MQDFIWENSTYTNNKDELKYLKMHEHCLPTNSDSLQANFGQLNFLGERNLDVEKRKLIYTLHKCFLH